MGGGRAKALADLGRGTGGSRGSGREALPPTKAGVLGPPPGVGTKNTWDVRRKEGVSRADSPGLARRPEKRERSYPWAGNEALGAQRVKAKGAGRRGKATRRAGLPGRGGTRRTRAAGPGRRRAPTRGRRSPTCPRGAGEPGAAAPEGPCDPQPPGPDPPRGASLLPPFPPTRGPLTRGRRTHQRLHLSPPLPQLLPAPPQPLPPPRC